MLPDPSVSAALPRGLTTELTGNFICQLARSDGLTRKIYPVERLVRAACGAELAGDRSEARSTPGVRWRPTLLFSEVI